VSTFRRRRVDAAGVACSELDYGVQELIEWLMVRGVAA